MSELVSTSRITGIGPRMLSAADRSAPLIGTVAGMWKPLAGGGGIEGAVSSATAAISQFKFANPIHTTMSALRQPGKYAIYDGVKGWAAGAIAHAFGSELGGDLGDLLKTGGSAAAKFGSAAATTSLVVSYFLEQGAAPGLLGGVTAFAGVGGGGGLRGQGEGTQAKRIRQDNPEAVGTVRRQGATSAGAFDMAVF